MTYINHLITSKKEKSLKLKQKPLEIFCGTGGVGKTTLAAARAIFLAQKGHRVLLVTIDPAKRLKDLLNLSSKEDGEVVPVEIENTHLHALLMSSEKTIQRMSSQAKVPDLKQNKIIQILSKPYGGMNEILSLVEVQDHLQSQSFDTIVLDTPPGAHFLDFLESLNKIDAFFEKTFVEIFSNFGKKTFQKSKSFFTSHGMLNKFMTTGLKKLMKYLERVTGGQFIEEFIEALQTIYQSKDSFLKGIELKDKLKSQASCNWFLVTSVEQRKVQEALEMMNHAKHFIHEDHFLVLNKCLETELHDWNPHTKNIISLKKSLIDQEQKIKHDLKQYFSQILEFPEIISHTPKEHLHQLTNTWNKNAL